MMLAVPSSWTSAAGWAPAPWVTKQKGRPPGERITTWPGSATSLAPRSFAAFAEARGSEAMEAYDRRIPSDVLRLAVSVVLWGATLVAGATIILMLINDEPLDYVLFDVISAFATCGLSTGFTQGSSDASQYVLAATMFFGRIGTVTLAAALAASTRRQLFRRAEERPIVG